MVCFKFLLFFYIFLELSFIFKLSQPNEPPYLTGKLKILEHILVDCETFW